MLTLYYFCFYCYSFIIFLYFFFGVLTLQTNRILTNMRTITCDAFISTQVIFRASYVLLHKSATRGWWWWEQGSPRLEWGLFLYLHNISRQTWSSKQFSQIKLRDACIHQTKMINQLHRVHQQTDFVSSGSWQVEPPQHYLLTWCRHTSV